MPKLEPLDMEKYEIVDEPQNNQDWDGEGNDITAARDKVLNEDTQRNAILDALQRLFLDGIADGGTGGSMDESVADAYLAIEEVYDAMPMINVGESDESIDRAVIKARIDELGQVHHDDKNNWVFTFAGVKPGESGVYLSDRIATLKQQLKGE